MIFNVESFAEFNNDNWSYTCQDKEQKICFIGIRSLIKNKKTDKDQTLATVYIQIGTSSKKKLDLLNEEDQTYKMGELITDVPVMFINFPLNTDLRMQPIIRVAGKDISGLRFSHCNQTIGCNSRLNINDEVIELFKKEKEMSLLFAIYGAAKSFEIKLPLKGFKDSYKKLSSK